MADDSSGITSPRRRFTVTACGDSSQCTMVGPWLPQTASASVWPICSISSGDALARELDGVQPRQRSQSQLERGGPEVVARAARRPAPPAAAAGSSPGSGAPWPRSCRPRAARSRSISGPGAFASTSSSAEADFDRLDAGALLHPRRLPVELRLGKFISQCVTSCADSSASATRGQSDEARNVQGRFARRPAGRGLARPGDGALCDRHRRPAAAGAGRLGLPVAAIAGPVRHPEPAARRATRSRSIPAQCMAPLPRAYQWADGSAYINHVELVRAARNAEVPKSFYTDPLMYQGGSDDFLGPWTTRSFPSEDWGIDFEAEVAVVTGDVPMGATPEQALEGIRLVMLANDWSLRNLIPDELAKGFGFFQSKPATAFSPVAVTLDELGDAWQGGRVHLTLQSSWNGRKVGMCDAGPEMTFHFGQLIAHICKTRNVRAGSIVGSRHGQQQGRDRRRAARRNGPRATAASPRSARSRPSRTASPPPSS